MQKFARNWHVLVQVPVQYQYLSLKYHYQYPSLKYKYQYQNLTRSSAIAEGPRDASCQLKSCQLPGNNAETTFTKSPEEIEVMKLEGYSGTMCNKHVHSTVTRSSRFHCPIGVINKPFTDRVVDITCIPTTCCGEIF